MPRAPLTHDMRSYLTHLVPQAAIMRAAEDLAVDLDCARALQVRRGMVVVAVAWAITFR